MAFYPAQLSKTAKESWAHLIKDAQNHNIPVLPPDMRYSKRTWAPHPKERAVLAGFEQVPGIAETTATGIFGYLADKDQEKVQWQDLEQIKGIGPKTIMKIEKWVCSEDPFNLYYAQRVLGDLREALKRRQIRLPVTPNYRSDEIPRDADYLQVTWMGIPKKREYKDFVEDERARSGKDTDEIMRTMERPDLLKSCVIKGYDDGEEDVYLRFNRFKYPRFKDVLERIKLDGSQVVVAMGMKRKGFGINLQVKQLIIIDLEEQEEEEEVQD
jgi:DNA polymerase-3 subunit alpha